MWKLKEMVPITLNEETLNGKLCAACLLRYVKITNIANRTN